MILFESQNHDSNMIPFQSQNHDSNMILFQSQNHDSNMIPFDFEGVAGNFSSAIAFCLCVATGVGVITDLEGDSSEWYSEAVRTCPIFCPTLGLGLGFGATGDEIVLALTGGG